MRFVKGVSSETRRISVRQVACAVDRISSPAKSTIGCKRPGISQDKYVKFKNTGCNFKYFSSNVRNTDKALHYETVSEETLESLADYFDEVLESTKAIADTDVTYNNGVLTVDLGKNGIYVINKQTPNKQIWLSSPFSGPKRYDFVDKSWIYKHDGSKLHDLLNEELQKVIGHNVDFSVCVYGTTNK